MTKSFVMIIADHDKKQFCVEGPMVDDTHWNTAVVEEKKLGRDIRCSVPGEEDPARRNRKKAAADYAHQYNYEEVPAGSI